MVFKQALYTIIILALSQTGPAYCEVIYSGGDGTSIAEAIVIENAASDFEGVDSEYVWLEIQFGPEGKVWQSQGQNLVEEDERLYDVLKIEFLEKAGQYKKGDVAYFYFDITEFYMAAMKEIMEGD